MTKDTSTVVKLQGREVVCEWTMTKTVTRTRIKIVTLVLSYTFPFSSSKKGPYKVTI